MEAAQLTPLANPLRPNMAWEKGAWVVRCAYCRGILMTASKPIPGVEIAFRCNNTVGHGRRTCGTWNAGLAG